MIASSKRQRTLYGSAPESPHRDPTGLAIIEVPGQPSDCDSRLKFATQLLRNLHERHFALVRVTDELAADLAACENMSRRFFGRELLGINPNAMSTPCSRGNFCGYHAPSRAKEVFRYRFGLEHCFEGSPFFTTVSRAAERLRRLASDIALALLSVTGSSEHDAQDLLGALVEATPHHDGGLHGTSSVLDGRGRFNGPMPPFDLFHYRNRDAGVSNCEPHADPGLVTLIPIANVPGLEVRQPHGQSIPRADGTCGRERAHGGTAVSDDFDFGHDDASDDDYEFKGCESGGEWVNVEELVHGALLVPNLQPTSSSAPACDDIKRFRVVTVLAGEVMEALTAGLVPSALHRVDNTAAKPQSRPPFSSAAGTVVGLEPDAPPSSAPPSKESWTSPPSRFSLVFDLQVDPIHTPVLANAIDAAAEAGTRRSAQPPLHILQCAVGRMEARARHPGGSPIKLGFNHQRGTDPCR